MSDSYERFCDKLEALIGEWRNKPMDDKPTYAEVVAALDMMKLRLQLEAGIHAGYWKDAGAEA